MDRTLANTGRGHAYQPSAFRTAISLAESLFAVWNRDGGIVLACREFALHGDMSSLHQTPRQLCEALSESNDCVALGLVFPLALVVLPRLGRRDRELGKRRWRSVVAWFRRCSR
jgi:hypothetical protein